MRLTVGLLAVFLLSGCYLGFWTYKASGGGTEVATGEEHEINYPAADAFHLTEDVLRGEGILFESHPPSSIITLWKKSDIPPGVWRSLIGVNPRYRYEVDVTPVTPNRSKVVVNVRAENIPDEEIERYKASKRLDIFRKIDDLAANLPPSPGTPSSGGVNFALLPNETLEGLAKRVTGSASNWKQIADDNNIKSPKEVAAYQTIWVRSTLLKSKPAAPEAEGN